MGFEGANVIFDTWVHPLVMGLEEHLLAMFRDDFEFNDEAGPSHLGQGAASAGRRPVSTITSEIVWTQEAQAELSKIPILRARQGAPQHRAIRDHARPGPDPARDPV